MMIVTGLCALCLCIGTVFAEEDAAEPDAVEPDTVEADSDAADSESGNQEETYEEPQIIFGEEKPQSGWYQSAPEIQIRHLQKEAVTFYRAEDAFGNLTEGEVQIEDGEEESKAVLPADLWKEGENYLEVWMETSSEGEVFRIREIIAIDQSAPSEVTITYPSKADGEELFFQSEVCLELSSSDKISGVKAIRCFLENGEEKIVEGGQGNLILPVGYSGTVKMVAVDQAGWQSEETKTGKIVCEDEAPKISLYVPGGFAGWHQQAEQIAVKVGEPGAKYGFSSGLSSISCYVDGEQVLRKSYETQGQDSRGNYIESDTLYVTPEAVSKNGQPVTLLVRAADRAGNSAAAAETLYIDLSSPVIQIEGIHDAMITGETACANVSVFEENALSDCLFCVRYTDKEGEQAELCRIEGKDWTTAAGRWETQAHFEKDGVYHCTVLAQDKSGRRSEQSVTVTVDKTSPVIRYVDQIDGSYVSYFEWNYSENEMIRDLTEYTCWIYLDGRPYFSGTRIEQEGYHFLEVRAVDAAGNETSAGAGFTVDHTPPVIQCGDARDGGSYEEKVMLSVWVDQEGERLKKITVNQEEQTLSADSRIFQYEIREPGIYHVAVEADDLAGNISVREMQFEVREKTGTVGKIITPLKNVFSKDSSGEDGAVGQDYGRTVKAAVILTVLGLLAAGGAVLRKCRKRKKRALP